MTKIDPPIFSRARCWENSCAFAGEIVCKPVSPENDHERVNRPLTVGTALTEQRHWGTAPFFGGISEQSVRQDVREEANQTVSSINRLTLFLKANSEVHDVDHVEKGAKFSTKLWRLTRVRVYSAETSGTDA